MAIVLLCSVSGAPGATTTALGLTLQWPRAALLADCDRDAPQAISGGYLGGQVDGRGMSSLLQTSRRQTSLRGGVLSHTQPLDDAGRKLLLPGFRHPAASTIFTSWGQLAEEFQDLHGRGMDVVVDAGRVGPSGLPIDLVRRCDLVLLTTRSGLRGLVGLSTHLPTVLEQVESASASTEVGLAIVGPGRPYSIAEIGAQFGLPVPVAVDWAPQHAEVLSDAATPPRRFDQSSFVASLVRSARSVHSRIGSRAAQRDAVLTGSTS